MNGIIHPLDGNEVEAAEIVSGTINLFKVMSIASGASLDIAMATLAIMKQDLEEDRGAKLEDLDEEGKQLGAVVIKMVQATINYIKLVIAARLELNCDGDCINCKQEPPECYTSWRQKTWS